MKKKKRKGFVQLNEAQKRRVEEMNRASAEERSLLEVFSKERMITYFFVIFLPPVGLYRVWYPKSTFRRSEKWVWTMMIVLYIGYFIWSMLK